MWKLIVDNKEWLFSGLGIAIITVLWKLFIVVKNNANNNNEKTDENKEINREISLQKAKEVTHILFIDDDVKFKVVKILKNSGWLNTNLVKDIKSLDANELLNSHIIFVDIQGVGKELGFQDEGLGLAMAIKNKHSLKRVIIYSAESQGDRFHKALKQADSFLAKNADPYEFQQLVEEYANYEQQ